MRTARSRDSKYVQVKGDISSRGFWTLDFGFWILDFTLDLEDPTSGEIGLPRAGMRSYGLDFVPSYLPSASTTLYLK